MQAPLMEEKLIGAINDESGDDKSSDESFEEFVHPNAEVAE